MNHRTKRYVFLCIVTFFGLLLAGCSDQPNPVGASILPLTDTPKTHRDTLDAVSHKSTKAFLVTRLADRMPVGIADIQLAATVRYESWGVIKFTQFPDTLLGATIVDATVQLRSSYRFGDSLSSLSFAVYRAVGNVLGDSLTLDSVMQRRGEYLAPSPLATVSALPPGDTGLVPIAITDTAMLNAWFATNTDTIHANDGLVLQPMPSGVLKGFSTFNDGNTSWRPALVVHYIKGGQPGTYTHQTGAARYLSAVNEAGLLADPQLVMVQSGISYRGFLTFDISKIPNPSMVSLATLDITLDPASSRFSWTSHDSLFAGFVNQDGTVSTSSYTLSNVVASATGHHYQFNITSFVQAWMKQPTLPRQIALSGFDENGALDLHALYGSAASAEVRPHIVITYSSTR